MTCSMLSYLIIKKLAVTTFEQEIKIYVDSHCGENENMLPPSAPKQCIIILRDGGTRPLPDTITIINLCVQRE